VNTPKSKIAIVFDDGFVKSSHKCADLFESFGLRAVFCVIADTTGFAPNFLVGDFALWNELQSRGHRIHPHGWRHTNLAQVPHAQAVDELRRCFDLFGEKLAGFDPKRVVYHYAYNSAMPELNEWLLSRVAAVRQNGSGFLGREQLESRIWHSTTFGPDDPTEHLMQNLEECRQRRPPAFMYTLHGIDGEAWGAIKLDSLKRALEMITSDAAMDYSTVPFD